MNRDLDKISPLRLLWLLVISIFTAETVVMSVILLSRQELSLGWQVFIDSTALLLITSPLLYLFFYRPLREQLMARDVAERAMQLALQQAREARDRIDTLLKSLSEGLVATDHENRIVLMNPAAEARLGLSAVDAYGRTLEALTFPGNIKDVLLAGCNCLEQPQQKDITIVDHEGSREERVLRFRCTPLPEQEGRIPGRITLFYDVTREAEADRLKSEFISLAAHELRTPLTAIIGYADILVRYKDLPQEDREDYVEQIRDGGLNLSQIIDELLDVARIEAGRGLELNCRDTEAEELFLQMELSRYAETSGHPLELQVGNPEAVLSVDTFKIRQVLINLLSNAFKYSAEGQAVLLSGQIKKDGYQISIRDEGIGMTPSQVERVFEKFYRADPGNTAIKGIGLGMYIVQHIIKAHHGRIWIESHWGKGTTVHITLPLQSREMVPAD